VLQWFLAASTSAQEAVVLTWYLLVSSSYLDQETAKESLRFSSQAATYYYQANHSKVDAIPLMPCPKTQQANLLACSNLLRLLELMNYLN